MRTLPGTLAQSPYLFHQPPNWGHLCCQGPVGADFHTAIAANTPAVIKRNRPAGFNHSGRRAKGPALPAAAAAPGIDDRLLEDMGPDKTL